MNALFRRFKAYNKKRYLSDPYYSDKGSGVVVMDKSDYLRLLSEASIIDATKFKPIESGRPIRRGRPPKHYHPLLEKEKHLESIQ